MTSQSLGYPRCPVCNHRGKVIDGYHVRICNNDGCAVASYDIHGQWLGDKNGKTR